MKKIRALGVIAGILSLGINALAMGSKDPMNANVFVDDKSVFVEVGDVEKEFKFDELKAAQTYQLDNGYSIIFDQLDGGFKMKISNGKEGDVVRLLLNKNGDVDLYNSKWSGAFDVSCTGDLNLLSARKNTSGKTCHFGDFDGAGKNVFVFGDIYVEGKYGLWGDVVCVPGKLGDKETSTTIKTPNKSEVDNFKKAYLSNLETGYWIIGEVDGTELKTIRFNVYVVGKMTGDKLSREGGERNLTFGANGFGQQFFQDYEHYFGVKITPNLDVETLSETDAIYIEDTTNPKIHIYRIEGKPTIDFTRDPKLKPLSVSSWNTSLESEDGRINIGSVDISSRITVDGKPIDKPPRGLSNLGNTCFANAALQLLLSSKPMREVFLSHTGQDDFMLAMKKLVEMWTAGGGAISGTDLQPLIKYIWPENLRNGDNVDGSQHDAWTDMLNYLLDTIVKKTQSPNTLPFVFDEQNKASTADDKKTMLYETVVPNQYHINLASYSVNRLEDDILNPRRYVDYSYTINEVTYNEVWDSRNVVQWPNLLFVAINRGYPWNPDVKDFTPLRIKEKFSLNDKEDYELKSVVQHLGSTNNGGHYIAHARQGEHWWLLNDSNVSEEIGSNFSNIKYDENHGLFTDQNARVLLFEKVAKNPAE